MKYKNTIRARFVSRPNRFTAVGELPADSSQLQKLENLYQLQGLQESNRSKKTQEFSGYRDPNQLQSAGLGDVAEDESAIPLSEPAAGWRRETVHVKNTGRCRELLIPGASVILEESGNSNRKTKYDLIMKALRTKVTLLPYISNSVSIAGITNSRLVKNISSL